LNGYFRQNWSELDTSGVPRSPGQSHGIASQTIGQAVCAMGLECGIAPSGAAISGVPGISFLLEQPLRAVEQAVRAAIGDLHPDLARIVSYHTGFTDEQGRPIRGRAGKGVRPTLAILSAIAAGARPEVGVLGGVAVELVHDFSLLHDDIIDNDRLRRGRSTAWTVFGVGPTLLAGDALLSRAFGLLAASPSHGPAAVRAFADAVMEICHGEADDLAFEHRGEVPYAEYVEMAASKTGSLLGCACAMGAILAGASDLLIRELSSFGRHLGVGFQIIDDILGIWGDPEVSGKPAHSDLRSRKKTFPVLAALAGPRPASAQLAVLLAQPGVLSADVVARCAQLVELAGGRRAAAEEAGRHRQQALMSLSRCDLPAHVDAALQAMAAMLLAERRQLLTLSRVPLSRWPPARGQELGTRCLSSAGQQSSLPR
jgi:geranylgeranyl diphosphate synthase, type I